MIKNHSSTHLDYEINKKKTLQNKVSTPYKGYARTYPKALIPVDGNFRLLHSLSLNLVGCILSILKAI